MYFNNRHRHVLGFVFKYTPDFRVSMLEKIIIRWDVFLSHNLTEGTTDMKRHKINKGSEYRNRAIVATLAKGLDLIDVISNARKPLSLTEISKLVPSDPGSLHRMLNTLRSRKFIVQDPSTKRYFLDAKVVHLSHSFFNLHHIYERTHIRMLDIAEISNETVQISIISGQRCGILVEEYKGNNSLSVSGSLGMRLPFHCTAHGKVLLAFQPLGVFDRIFPRLTLEKFTAKTITSPSQLKKEMKQVRLNGYAVNDGEFIEDIRCIAAPVFNHTGRPVASLGVIGFASRFTRDRINDIIPFIVESSQQASKELGYISGVKTA